MKKEYLGTLILIGGIAVIGFVWFKRNKPTIASTQLSDLAMQPYKSSQVIDVPFSEQGSAKIEKEAIAQHNWNLLNTPLTPSQIAEMEKAGWEGGMINPYSYDIFHNMDLRGI